MRGFVPWITLLVSQPFPSQGPPQALGQLNPYSPAAAGSSPLRSGSLQPAKLVPARGAAGFHRSGPIRHAGGADARAPLPCVPGPAARTLLNDEQRHAIFLAEGRIKWGSSPPPASATVHFVPLCGPFPLRSGQDCTLCCCPLGLGKLLWH